MEQSDIARPGTVALSRKAPTKPSEVEASSFDGRQEGLGPLDRVYDLSSLCDGVEAARQSFRLNATVPGSQAARCCCGSARMALAAVPAAITETAVIWESPCPRRALCIGRQRSFTDNTVGLCAPGAVGSAHHPERSEGASQARGTASRTLASRRILPRLTGPTYFRPHRLSYLSGRCRGWSPGARSCDAPGGADPSPATGSCDAAR
jgi:hypothetical protein